MTMQLLTSATSSYARIVRVVLAETGLGDRVEVNVVRTRVPDSPVNRFNPTGKVPTLVTEDGHALSEARLICHYLDGLHDGEPFMDVAPTVQARAFDGMIAGFLDGVSVWVREMRRSENERSPGILLQERNRVHRCLDFLQTHGEWRELRADFARISLAVALESLDGASLMNGWREDWPDVASWHESFSQRPSMLHTSPYA